MKRRQRGLSTLDLIMYAAAAVALLGVLAGVNAGLKNHYVAPERLKWEKEKAVLTQNVATLKNDVSTCTSANKSLEDQFATFRRVHDEQIKNMKAEDDAARARRLLQEKKNAPTQAQIAMDKFNMIVSLGKQDGGMSCEQYDAYLLEDAKRKVKYYGGTNEPTAQQPDAGAVRITPQPVVPAERPRVNNPLRLQ